MGEADVILGIRIKHESNRIPVSYSHYIEKILKKFNYFDCTLVSTLMDTSEKLRPINVGKLSMYTSNPSTQHWQAVQSVLNNAEDNSSTRNCVFLLRGGDISWASKKKTSITSSTMESEFVALKVAATLAKAYSQMYNRKSRHLGVKSNMIRELITNGVIYIEFVRSQQNLDGYLTKGLARNLVIKSAKVMI
nr:hypothetical protein [Tanacetum cinerariifolium]